MLVEEGGVTVEVPEASGGGEGATEAVFFNPTQELNRDLTVATLSAYRQRESRAETYLDAMAASGIRGVRAAASGWDATLADLDPEAVALARENLARNDLDGTVVERNVNSLLHEEGEFFDVVDLDPFGTPIPFADAAFANARNLVCVTATDTAPLCGAHFESGVRKYGAVPRNTEYHAEMGLRVLLSALARTAARYDVGVTPILSHVSDHYVRTYLDLSHTATDANEALDELGYVYHCQECLHRSHDDGLIAHPPDECARCGGTQVLPAGPLWLGPAHDREFVATVREHVTDEMGTAKRARKLLDTIEGELHQPTHFDQHRLYKQWSEPAVGMDEFLAELREAGIDASRAHYGGTTFKADAAVADIEAAIQG
ncbi:tRNA (guanine(26)-N(2))-dimethyltransferase [Halobacterium bonnevillei]|uniref:tRNA (guanine(26)-N(2))-dimethyltransferase n=1 Tax=Halobacterium bonnevillei TaxID=2692200 RepID=A0A6B0SFN9_9EURY|nr:tRNA (guanine(26)-N(2))-dimethyltransferase [Halobacterium bonnevillei]MXR20584.1 tRNA (guanine(26)-N(2))-dimethyltransferase [Halobacterium bonnevillei]